jgi:hypothetical protein
MRQDHLGSPDRIGCGHHQGDPNANRSVGGNEPLDLENPRLSSRGRDRELACVTRDLAGIGEEIRNRRHVECLECRTIGIEEISNRRALRQAQGTMPCSTGNSASQPAVPAEPVPARPARGRGFESRRSRLDRAARLDRGDSRIGFRRAF